MKSCGGGVSADARGTAKIETHGDVLGLLPGDLLAEVLGVVELGALGFGEYVEVVLPPVQVFDGGAAGVDELCGRARAVA